MIMSRAKELGYAYTLVGYGWLYFCVSSRERKTVCVRKKERERVRECERGYSDIIAVKKLCMRLLNS